MIVRARGKLSKLSLGDIVKAGPTRMIIHLIRYDFNNKQTIIYLYEQLIINLKELNALLVEQ